MCGHFFPHTKQSIRKWTPAECPLIQSVLTFSSWSYCQIPQVKCLVPQDCLPLQMQVASPMLCYLCFWSVSYKMRVPQTPSSVSIYLLDDSQNSGKCLCLRFIAKDIITKDAYAHLHGRDALGKECVKEFGVSMPSLGIIPSTNLSMFSNPEDLWTLSFWDFMKASLRRHNRHNCLHRWPLIISSTFRPSLGVWGGEGVELKDPTL